MIDMHDTPYRVTPQPKEEVELSITLPNEQVLHAWIAEVNVKGCKAYLLKKQSIALCMGTVVTLRFRVHNTMIDVPAQLVHRTDTDEVYTCEFRFTTSAMVPPSFYTLFNWRTAYRVTPSKRVCVSLWVVGDSGTGVEQPSGTAFMTQLKDISSGGVGLRVNRKIETHLVSCDSVALRFRLTRSAPELQFLGRIQNRRWQDKRTILGVEFDKEGSVDVARQVNEIHDYVLHRLQHEVKHAGAINARLLMFS